MTKSLVLMIHGLSGDVATWGIFPKLLSDDPNISQLFTIHEPYTYTTNRLGIAPGISALARELATYLSRDELAGYERIAILAHSMGGLIAKRLVADILIDNSSLRIDRIMTFASPMLGAAAASLGKITRGSQVRDLAIGSEFMVSLGHHWASTNADTRVIMRHVIAGDDAVVGPWSGTTGYRYRAYDTIGGVGHIGIVKPQDANATVFQLAKQFLLLTSQVANPGRAPHDSEQPILDTTILPNDSVAPDNIARFIYRARAVPFFGREHELITLREFLSGADPFRWMVISGAGGTGKSRIALELCLEFSNCWYAGFLREYSRSQEDWNRWQPLVPTLMVLDYATQTPESTRNLLHVLAQRTMPGATFPITQPIRVLLLIRPADQSALDGIVSGGEAAEPVRMTGGKILKLGEIRDPWPIFKTIFKAAKRRLPNKRATLDTFSQYDPKGRPLFAIFLADAMANTSEDKPAPYNFDTKRLLKDVIERWRNRIWTPAYESERLGHGEAEETLLALATMTGGIPIKHSSLSASNISDLLPKWDTYKHPRVFEVMTGKPVSDEVPTLEPDVVGEHFVVLQLARRTKSERQSLINLAWSINAPAMAAFILRGCQDLPEDQFPSQVLNSLLSKPFQQTIDTAYWRSQLGINLLANLGFVKLPKIYELLDEMEAYANEYTEKPFKEFWAKAANNALLNLVAFDFEAAQTLLEKMMDYAERYNETPLRLWWGNGALNMLTDLLANNARLNMFKGHLASGEDLIRLDVFHGDVSNTDLDMLNDLLVSNARAVQALLEQLKACADTHAEAPLRECWAKGVFKVLNGLLTYDVKAAREMLEQLKAYADLHAEAPLRKCWAQGAVNMIIGLVSRDPDAAQSLLGQMKAYADTHADAPLRKCWAQGAVNVIIGLVSRAPDAAQLLLTQMKAYADSHDEAPLREYWAQGAFNVIIGLVGGAPDAAQSLLTQMKAYADAHDDAPLREYWAQGAVTLLNHLSTHAPDAAQSLLTQMKAYADSHDDAPLREYWAQGAVNILTDLPARDLSAAQVLLEEMAVYAGSHDDAPLRRCWAQGALKVLNGLLPHEIEAAQALLEKMQDYAADYDEAPLRASWAEGAYKVLTCLDPKAVQTLLKQMKAFADAHDEPPLRECWAHGAVYVLIGLGASEPKTSRALIKQMKAYVDVAPLRKCWVNGAVSFQSDLAASKPTLSLKFYFEVVEVLSETTDIVELAAIAVCLHLLFYWAWKRNEKQRLKRLEANQDIESRTPLPILLAVKYLFARESDQRKNAEEQWTFLHRTNTDDARSAVRIIKYCSGQLR